MCSKLKRFSLRSTMSFSRVMTRGCARPHARSWLSFLVTTQRLCRQSTARSPVAASPTDAERVIEIAMLRANALAWQGDVDAARRAVDAGEVEVERHRETYWHGRLAMVGLRVEADAATAATASRSLPDLERSHARADAIRAEWIRARDELEHTSPLVDAYSLAIDAEMARVAGENVRETATRGRERLQGAFDALRRYVLRMARRAGDARRGRPSRRDRALEARAISRVHARLRWSRERDHVARARTPPATRPGTYHRRR